ncbi:MAG: hypothetical protein R3C68_15050 [Myxococcota bacterium]
MPRTLLDAESGVSPRVQHAAAERALQTALKDPQFAERFMHIKDAYSEGCLSLAEIGGFSQDELDATYRCACSLVAQKKIPEALTILGILLLIDPNRARYHQLAGIAFQTTGAIEQADIYYNVALGIERDPLTLMYAGEVRTRLGFSVEGTALLLEGLAQACLHPELSPPWLGRRY